MRFTFFAGLASLLLAPAAMADTAIVVIGNESYDRVPDVRNADTVARDARRLRPADTTILTERDADADAIADSLADFEAEAGDADTLVVVLAGSFAHSATETYFLTTEADTETLAGIQGDAALPLSTVMAYLAARPARAFLVLGHAGDEAEPLNAFLRSGLGPVDPAQGVTVLEGDIASVTDFVRNRMTREGALVSEADDLTVSGFLPSGHSVYPSADVVAAPAPVLTDENSRRRDIQDWRRALDLDTADAFEQYLDAHPNGAFVAQAEAALAERLQPVEPTPQEIEAALQLTRNQRRDIQRDLSLLDFNTRGIDGIFGRGTRAAVQNWQRRERFEATGFLTREQISLLDDQAAVRAAELEAEAEKRRLELLAADRAYWAETGATERESGYRAYLERYPDGEFADIAKARLEAIEDRRRAEASAEDRRLWDQARRLDRISGYREYLERQPRGAFRDDARARIRELRDDDDREDENREALRIEQGLNLNPVTRRIVEQRLARAGFNPGPQDGVFDDDTRRAIRRYQASRNLPSTGYLSDAVMVRLLADSVRSIFE